LRPSSLRVGRLADVFFDVAMCLSPFSARKAQILQNGCGRSVRRAPWPARVHNVAALAFQHLVSP
jgi:hypothetical protein